MKLRELNNKYEVTNIRWGIVRTKNLSDELDSATIILTHISKINIEPYDIVELTNENNEFEYWLIGHVSKQYLTYTSPFLFEYTIDLMSPTKLLEMCMLPSMAITNVGEAKPVKYYIQSVFEKYFKSNNLYKQISEFGTAQVYNGILAKEYVFQNPTMREFFDGLLSQISSIAKLEIYKNSDKYFFRINPFSLNQSNGNIPVNYIETIQEENGADSYITSIVKDSDSVLNQIPTIENHYPISTEILTNNNNVKIILNRKIYDIQKLIVKSVKFVLEHLTEIRTLNNYYVIGGENTYTNETISPIRNVNLSVGAGGSFHYPTAQNIALNIPDTMDLDLTDYLMPLQVFNTLETLEAGEIEDNIRTYCNRNVKNNTLFYQRGDNVIENLNYFESKKVIWWNNNDAPAVVNAIFCAAVRWAQKQIELGTWKHTYTITEGQDKDKLCYVSYFLYNPTNIAPTVVNVYPKYNSLDWEDDYKSTLFKIQYQPYTDLRLAIDKNKQMHLIESPDSSTNVNSDIGLEISQSFEKVKQLANDNLIFTGFNRVLNSNYEPVFKLGQIFIDEDNNKYVLTKIEWQTSKNSIKYKGTLSKNYSSKILNTLLNREKRYYTYADVSDTIKRHEVVKQELNITIANNRASNHETAHNILCDICNFVKFITWKSTNTSSDSEVIAKGSFPANTVRNKDLITYNFEFKDNISYGEKITNETIANVGGYINQIKKYVNDDGEIRAITYYLGTNSQIDENTLANYDWNWLMMYFIDKTVYLHKDNREQLSFTHQIKLNANANYITLHDVDWVQIEKNGLKHVEAFFYEYLDESHELNIDLGNEVISDIFDFDFNVYATQYGCTINIMLVDNNDQSQLLLTLDIPGNYSSSVFLKGDLINLD